MIEAEDLVAKDINVFSKDTSDPYAVITGMFSRTVYFLLQLGLTYDVFDLCL